MKVKFLATKRAKQNISVIRSERKLKGQQVNWLKRLDELVQSCERCRLFEGGRAKPYWTKHSRYAIIGEAPWTEEVKANECFVDTTGKLLWKTLGKHKLFKKDFIIINSVNCKPVFNRTKKPTSTQVGICNRWVNLYLKVAKPKKILVLGNNAMGSLFGDFDGITGKVGYVKKYMSIPAMLCVHPSYALYNEDIGRRLLVQGIEVFKNL